MNDEFETLTPAQQRAVHDVIAEARAEDGRHSITLPDRSEVYAYAQNSRIAWGVNSGMTGFNVARGVVAV